MYFDINLYIRNVLLAVLRTLHSDRTSRGRKTIITLFGSRKTQIQTQNSIFPCDLRPEPQQRIMYVRPPAQTQTSRPLRRTLTNAQSKCAFKPTVQDGNDVRDGNHARYGQTRTYRSLMPFQGTACTSPLVRQFGQFKPTVQD